MSIHKHERNVALEHSLDRHPAVLDEMNVCFSNVQTRFSDVEPPRYLLALRALNKPKSRWGSFLRGFWGSETPERSLADYASYLAADSNAGTDWRVVGQDLCAAIHSYEVSQNSAQDAKRSPERVRR